MADKKTENLNKHDKKRFYIQALGALIINGDWKNFLNGTIYKGNLKHLCLPVLNCYSCPGALGSCPIGSLQAVANDPKFNLPYYALGLIAFFGIILGRWFCGWLCPFGWFQELFYKIPLKKIKVAPKVHNVLRYLKFVLLAIFVFAIPIFISDQFNIGYPAFCKWICPAGTLEAGLPLVIANQALRQAMGVIFSWKILLLIITIIGSISIFRFFCKYACPLGALYGLFNKVSFYHMECSSNCIECQACTRICKMNIEPYKNPNSVECIRCGDCVKVCPVNALHLGFKHEKEEIQAKSQQD
ncbi:MAG TPA: 4Fe-4S binding protein [Candidatus Eisenbacteria bacterium]|nr:4Fe-4S binding protein [Candidatus Eisenbacteria bacterium]